MKQPKSVTILQSVIAALQKINTTKGYYTNAGQRVFSKAKSFEIRDSPGICAFVTEESALGLLNGTLKAEMNVTIEGHTSDNPLLLVDDIKRVIINHNLSNLVNELSYNGFSIEPPIEGTSTSHISMRISIIYFENLKEH